MIIYSHHNYLSIRSNLTPPPKNRFKTAQKVIIEPDMATYWFKCEIQVFNHKLDLSQLFTYPVKFDPP